MFVSIAKSSRNISGLPDFGSNSRNRLFGPFVLTESYRKGGSTPIVARAVDY